MTVVSAFTPYWPILAAKASASSRRLGTGGVLVDKSWRQCTKIAPGICPAAYTASPRGCAAVGGTKRASIMRRVASCRWSTNHSILTKIWRSRRRGIRIPCNERASAGDGGEQAQERGPPGILATFPYFRVGYAGQRADIVVACGQVSSDRSCAPQPPLPSVCRGISHE